MARVLTRTNFLSSSLIRVLSDLALVDVVEPEVSFAEQMGHWLNLNDAITLCAVHTANPSPTSFGVKRVEKVVLIDEFERVRANLVNSITRCDWRSAGRVAMALLSSESIEPIDLPSAYEPYHQNYLVLQRAMDSSIPSLRGRVREVLARRSSSLRQLATLDAAFDAILRDRESKLFTTIPSLLERRFEHLFKTCQRTQVASQPAGKPAQQTKSCAWLDLFCQELQTVLMAELDTRLQPTIGLMEAFNNEISKKQ